MPNQPDPTGPQLPLRLAFILVFALLMAAAVVGLLTLDGQSPTMVTLAGVAAFASVAKFFHWLIAT